MIRPTPETDAARHNLTDYRSPVPGSYGYWVYDEAQKLKRERDEALRERDEALEALRDMLSGWKYIRQVHGDLYGVGWDRAQTKAEKVLEETK